MMTFLALVLAIVIIITLDEPERAGCHTYTSTCVSPIAVIAARLTAQRLFFLRSIAGHQHAVVPSVACR